MATGPSNPTLLVTLGRFGREVATHLREPTAGQRRNIQLVMFPFEADSGADAPGASSAREPEDMVAEVEGCCRRLLDLAERISSSAPGDGRLPQVDLFVLADLGEPAVAPRVPGLVALLGERLRERFRPIFRSGSGFLAICPILALPREAARQEVVRQAIAGLDALARDPDSRRQPGGPVYLVEDQTTHYVLSREELVRTVTAYLHLVLYSGVRGFEGGVRGLVEHHGGRRAPFATFGCATIDFEPGELRRHCEARIAQEVLDALLRPEGTPPAELAALAARLIPAEAALASGLSRDGTGRRLDEQIDFSRSRQAARIPTPGWRDSPEEIEASCGADWLRRLEGAIAAEKAAHEEHRMAPLAREVDQQAYGQLRVAEQGLEAELNERVSRAPSGWSEALAVLAQAEGHAVRAAAAAKAAVESPRLPPFPDLSRARSEQQRVLERVALRPRLGRLLRWGLLQAAAGAVFLTAVLRGTFAMVGRGGEGFFLPWVEPEDGLRYLVGWPYAAVWMTLLAVAWVAGGATFNYWRRHRHLRERIDALQAAAGAAVQAGERYFRARLEYSQQLWRARIHGRLLDRLRGDMAALEAVRVALERSRDAVAAELRAAEEGQRQSQGVLFRAALGPEEMAALYESHARPASPRALAAQHLEETLREAGGTSSWRAAPFADRAALARFASRVCPDLSAINPFDSSLAPAVAKASLDKATTFLQELAAFLTPPIELALADGREPTLTKVGYVPPQAAALVSSVMRAHDLGGRWSVREAPDPRLHLLVTRDDISLSELKLLQGGEP